MINRDRLIRHAAKRRLDYPRGSAERKRWKTIMYALAYNATFAGLSRALARDR